MRPLAISIAILLGLGGRALADEPQARFQLDRGAEPHAGMPFTLILGVTGFEENPPPELPKLEISGAKVTPAGAQPNMQRSVMIINGHQSQSTQVTWVLRWRIEVAKEGRILIPATTVTQGSRKATAQGAQLDVDSVPVSDDMRLELQLPQRPVFVGETIEAKLAWTFRRQPESQTFDIPLASMDEVTISAPPVTDKRRRVIELQLGAKALELPYEVDNASVNGQSWTRVTIKLFVAPRAVGKLAVAPASVAAGFAIGRADFFGNAPTKLFRASDSARTLEVKPLPESDKPPSFTGAVGSQFSIAVATSRSVVQLGEPVELAITVKSDQRLDTLSVGKLDYEGGLPKDKFKVPADPPTGELAEDGKTKTFKVTATVTGQTTEIPALAFAYFDPAKGTYQTIHSDPIALSVKGGTVVGAGDVIATAPKHAAATPSDSELALVGADLALSAPSDVSNRPLGGTVLWLLLALLYAVPLGAFALRTWRARTRSQRDEAAEVRTARRAVERALDHAKREPARDTAGPLASAVRALARTLEREVDDDGLLARLETESFAPSASSEPLSAELRDRVAELVRRWTATRVPASKPSAVSVLIVVLAMLAATRARAATTDADPLADGRRIYEQAMTISEASSRRATFARSEAALAEAVRAEPDRPELLADLGNAALGAGDVGTATLAYRRALAIDGGNLRARRNLAWLRGREPESLRPSATSAADTLFFFNEWPRSRRLVVGAIAFAAVVLLMMPWGSRRRRRGLAVLALLPTAVWLVMIISVAIEDRHTDDAVVMDAVVLRAADSAGAPAALTQPLPRGTEVTVTEHRETWTKVRTASGTAGWVQSGALQAVAR